MRLKRPARKKHLEMYLELVPDYISPSIGLEQYKTPAPIAANILWDAYNLSDIKDRRVMDLGCGTGIFAIGSAILGAKKVFGVDIDEGALKIGKRAAEKMGVADKIRFIKSDIRDDKEFSRLSQLEIDTLIQNPPFGSQRRSRRGADRIFIKRSISISPVVYSFHMAGSEDFVKKYFRGYGGRITHRAYYRFPIPRIYEFHEKEILFVDVIVLRVEKDNF